MAKRKFDVSAALKLAATEEEVKSCYVKWLDLEVNTQHKNDLLDQHGLWEFKYDRNLSDPGVRAKTLAQAAIYLRRHQREQAGGVLPERLILADKNEAVVCPSSLVTQFFDTPIDWRRAASDPAPELVQALMPLVESLTVYDMTGGDREVFAAVIRTPLDQPAPKRVVTLGNFEQAYTDWCTEIGLHFAADERGLAFMTDLACTGSVYNETTGKLRLLQNGRVLEAHVPVQAYQNFWRIWHRPPDVRDYQRMLSHTDRLQKMQHRRLTGQFYTPLPVARLALDYLARELGENWQDEYYVWDPCCYSADTEVLTRSGWKLFTELSREDEFYSLNPVTGAGEYCRAIRHISKPFSGKLHRYSGDHMDLLVTPDHSMLVYPRIRCDRPGRKPPRLLSSEMLRAELERGNVRAFRQTAVCTEPLQYLQLSIDRCKLLGLYLGDGFHGRDARKKVNALCFKFSKPRKVKYLRYILNAASITHTCYDDSEYCATRVVDQQLIKLCRDLGTARHKRLPISPADLTQEQRLAVLDGLRNSDGNSPKTGPSTSWRYYTASPQLANDVQRLAVHSGLSASISSRTRVIHPPGSPVPVESTEYAVSISAQPHMAVKRSNVVEEEYAGMVYCAQLERNHVLMVRRNGKTAWCGNCGTGNLTYYMDRYDRCFLSTLQQDEVDYVVENELAPGATVFQYDFCNDDVQKMVAGDPLDGTGWKLPAELRRVLKEEPEKLVVLMNPPYAAATDGAVSGAAKAGVTDTAAKRAFGDAGKAQQELFIQFLLRSAAHNAAVAAVFSTLKLENTADCAKVRNLLSGFHLVGGFCVFSKVFHGVNGDFPIGFQLIRRKQ